MYLLLSGGGFDSTIVTVLQSDKIAVVVNIDYGQKAFTGEAGCARYFAYKYGIAHTSIKTTDFSEYVKNPILKGGVGGVVIDGKWEEVFEGDRFEARNLMLLSIGTILACAWGLSGVVTGFHKESSNKFMDALPEFYSSFKKTVSKATNYPLKFWAPLQEKGLGRLDSMILGLKADPEVWHAYTCYGAPSVKDGEVFSCGTCVHCYKRLELARQLRRAGVTCPLPLSHLGHIDHREEFV